MCEILCAVLCFVSLIDTVMSKITGFLVVFGLQEKPKNLIHNMFGTILLL